MAKFLNTSATNYYLEELIKNASERLILISPFLKLNDRIRELTKARRYFTVEEIGRPRVAKTKVSLHSKDSIIQKALKQAEKEYGLLAGIDHLKSYDAKEDPYLKHLKKNKRSILGF